MRLRRVSLCRCACICEPCYAKLDLAGNRWKEIEDLKVPYGLQSMVERPKIKSVLFMWNIQTGVE